MSETSTSLSWALTTAARRQGVVIDTQRLGTALAAAAGKNGAYDIARICRALNLARPRHLAKPERPSLPLLCQVKGQGWGLLVDQRPDGRWDFLSNAGQRVVGEPEITGGSFRVDFAEQDGKQAQQGFERVFLDAIGEFRPVLIEIVVASVVMSIIALGASIFSMQVYDRVIPTHGVATLIVLAIRQRIEPVQATNQSGMEGLEIRIQKTE